MDIDSKKGFIIATAILTLGVLTFAGLTIWSFGRYSDLESSTNNQINTAVNKAETEQKQQLEAKFTEENKLPYRTYQAPADKSGIVINYPKSWSAEVDESPSGSRELYFLAHPKEIMRGSNNLYAFTLYLSDNSYDRVLDGYSNEIKDGDLVAKPYALPSVRESVGIQLTGEISNGKQGRVILIKVRDKTIVAYTESPNYINDFQEIMDKYVVYSP